MFQIITNWRLLNIAENLPNASDKITLRGYDKEGQILLPAEFVSMKPLSVDRIASIYCPTRRDLFLEVVKKKKGETKWGRVAGTVIEEYFSGLLGEYQELFVSGSQTYESLNEKIGLYVSGFVGSHSKQLAQLEKRSGDSAEHHHFMQLLEYAGRSELAMLGADWMLNGNSNSQIEIDRENVNLNPDVRRLGISSPSTPDFLLPSVKAVGDVKSGDQFKDFFRLICAGYALAYESEKGASNNIDFGVIYFLPTHLRPYDFTTANTHTFLIDDLMRKEFIDKRNEAYNIVRRAPDDPPPLVDDKDSFCKDCKFLKECYPDE